MSTHPEKKKKTNLERLTDHSGANDEYLAKLNLTISRKRILVGED